MNNLKVKNIFGVLSLLLLVMSSAVDSYSAPVKMHRAHPPKGSDQYYQEAERMRLEALDRNLNLTESQKEALWKVSSNRLKELKKIKEKEEKNRNRYEKECLKVDKERNDVLLKSDKAIESILSPEQNEKYKLLMKERENPTVCPEVSESEKAGVLESEPEIERNENEGGIGKIVKAPDPTILYE